MNFPDILTIRLRLCTMDDTPRNADQAGDYTALGLALGCAVAPQWPPEHWEPHVFTFLNEDFTNHPDHAGWNRYIVLSGGQDIFIGNCNAFAVNDSEGEVGYSVVPAFEGQGIATEATTALLTFLKESSSIRSVRAHTFPHLPRSIRVMEKCGFRLEGPGEEASTGRYRLDLHA